MARITYTILKTLSENPLNPGEIAARTRLPRYEVLAGIHVLEELGFIETIYARGTHKVYTLTRLGRKLLEAIENGDYLLGVMTTGEQENKAEAGT